MKKIGIIIKHPFREYDWRIDIYSVSEEMTHKQIHDYVMSKMLGPFEIVAITDRICFDRNIE